MLAVLAAAASPLLPISLHEHAQLVPETLAAPLVLTGALACSRSKTATLGGMLLALAAAFKVAFFVPAFAVAVVSSARRSVLLSLLLTGLLLGSASLAVFGVDVWRQAIEAQFEVGDASARYVGGLLAQAAWNELPLLIGTAAAIWLLASGRAQTKDPPLLRTLTLASAASLLLALTVIKRGSYINVLVVAEPPLLVLAACGAAWSWERWRSRRPLIVLLAAFLTAQSASLLIDPSDPLVAKRPGASSGLTWLASPVAVDSAVALTKRCPPNAAYPGSPYIAFLANRQMPGRQPDLFMIENAPIDASFAEKAAEDTARCS